MSIVRRVAQIATTALFAVVLHACGGSSGTGSTSIPGLSNGTPATGLLHAAGVTAGDVVAINAGGAVAGSFAADTGFVSAGTWTYKTPAAIDTSSLGNPASQAVYQDDREGSVISYSISGLTPGAAYTVRLSFAELWWSAAGQRRFNASINTTRVLTNFDIIATAGARYKAVSESFTATAGSTGIITIQLNAVTNYAAIDAIEIVSGSGAAPAPTSPPGTGVAINIGGSVTGYFSADADYAANGSWISTAAAAIDTTGVTGPAPQAVYQSQRVGSTVSYTIPNLTAGTTYTLRLDFAELFWTAAGQRVFNVSINNALVLSNFDIVATAGSRYRAIAKSFTATAGSNGTITIALAARTNYAAVNGIEITSGGGSPPASTFNDYSTFGYDNQRDVFNPNSTGLTPASVSTLHLAWQSAIGGGDYNTGTQPVLATEIAGHAGVLFVGGGSGRVYGYDALTGKIVWTNSIGQMSYTVCGSGTSYFGTGGTVAYDSSTKSVYVVGNTNAAANAYGDNALYRLDAATGQMLGHVDFTPSPAGASEQNFSHTAVTLNNGVAYVGTGSTCDISSWRGRVVAINVPSMTIKSTFFTVWDPQNARGAGNQSWSGGGIWGWGGVSLDLGGNVLTGVGNTDNFSPHGRILAPFVPAPKEYSGYGETLLELGPNLTNVIANHHPIAINSYNSGMSSDLDVQGTPLVFNPNGVGCGAMVAIQSKSGQLSIYDEGRLSAGSVAQYQLSPSTYDDGYLGDPAYSPATGLVYAPVASSISPTLFAPGLIAIDPGCGSPSVAWHAAFGSDSTASGIARSVPATSAGGVVLAGSVNGQNGQVWALNASTGTVLNGGVPVLQTSGHLRMPATIDGDWVFILDNNGNMYGLTTDSHYATVAAQRRTIDSRSREQWTTRRRSE